MCVAHQMSKKKKKKKKFQNNFLSPYITCYWRRAQWQGSGGSGGDSAFEWGGGEVLVAA